MSVTACLQKINIVGCDDDDDDDEGLGQDDNDDRIYQNVNVSENDKVMKILEKLGSNRDDDDLELLMDFTKYMIAFNNVSQLVKRDLCKQMTVKCFQQSDWLILSDGEELKNWYVVLNGSVKVVKADGSIDVLNVGQAFGITNNDDDESVVYRQDGCVFTNQANCQLLIVEKVEYIRIFHEYEDSKMTIEDNGSIVMILEKFRCSDNDEDRKNGYIVVQGTKKKLITQLFETNSCDPTYIEDFLLTYRVFIDDPVMIISYLYEVFKEKSNKNAIALILILWMNNHFEDFEDNKQMLSYVEMFKSLFVVHAMVGHFKMLEMALATHSQPRIITLSRSDKQESLKFVLISAVDLGVQGVFVLKVDKSTKLYRDGMRVGDQILEVNSQNFDLMMTEAATSFIKERTHLIIKLKYNHQAFQEACALKSVEPHNKSCFYWRGNRKFGSLQHSTCSSRNVTDRQNNSFNVSPLMHKMSILTSNDDVDDDGAVLDDDNVDNGTFFRLTRLFSIGRKKSYPELSSSSLSSLSSSSTNTSSYSSSSSSSSSTSSKFKTLFVRKKCKLSQIESSRCYQTMSNSNPDLLDNHHLSLPSPNVHRHSNHNFSHKRGPFMAPNRSTVDGPNNDVIIRVFMVDHSYRNVFISKYTTSRDVVVMALNEFGCVDNPGFYSLCEVLFEKEGYTKTRMLADHANNLFDRLAINARYYLKHSSTSTIAVPDESIPVVMQDCRFTLLDLPAMEVAVRLTLKSNDLVRSIKPSEHVVDLMCSKLNKKSCKANLEKFSNLSNEEMFWVITEICSEQDIIKRMKLVKHFIKIAKLCRRAQNFNSSFAITSGLMHGSVSRMKQTWDKLPPKYLNFFEELQEDMNPSRNMAKYRNLMNSKSPNYPAIPFYPMFKKDLTFIHLCNDTMASSHLVNFEKMRMLAREVRNFNNITAGSYKDEHETFKPFKSSTAYGDTKRKKSIPVLHKRFYEELMMSKKTLHYLNNVKVIFNENELSSMSIACEPPLSQPVQVRRTSFMSLSSSKENLLNFSSNENRNATKEDTSSSGKYANKTHLTVDSSTELKNEDDPFTPSSGVCLTALPCIPMQSFSTTSSSSSLALLPENKQTTTATIKIATATTQPTKIVVIKPTTPPSAPPPPKSLKPATLPSTPPPKTTLTLLIPDRTFLNDGDGNNTSADDNDERINFKF